MVWVLDANPVWFEVVGGRADKIPSVTQHCDGVWVGVHSFSIRKSL